MKKSIDEFVNTVRAEPLVFTIGICVLLLAVMGTSVRHVSSTMFTIVFLLSFSVIKDWRKLYLSLSNVEKIFLLGFLLYTISGILSFYNVDDPDKFYKLFERYLRFTLIIPVYLLLISKNRSLLNYLVVGAVISGPFMLAVALQHYMQYPDVPAKGYYHHIIFGQLAMLNVGVMLASILTKKLSRQVQLLVLLSMLCGIATAVLSQARGVWLVFPVYLIVAFFYALKKKRISTWHSVMFLAAIVLISIVTPIGHLIQQRTAEGITEINRFYQQDQYVSSVGTRLAMWDIAIDVWEQHPILGTGPGDFDDEVIALQRKGDYQGMDVHNSVHNIYIQALVGSGLIGLLALILVVLIIPLRLFFDRVNQNEEGRLTGFIIIISFAIYGLSESWTLRLPAISIFLIYITIIASHLRILGSQNRNESRNIN
jgi:O-antigen ligase